MPEQGNFLRKVFVKAYCLATEWLYGPLAGAYDAAAWLVSFGGWPRWRREALTFLVPGNILETGFGTGSLLIEMSRRGLDATGIEPSRQMQRVTEKKLARKSISIKRAYAEVQSLPFPKGAFSNVLSTFPTNYIADAETLAEVHRILTPAGRWVIVGLGLQFKSQFKQFLVGWLLGDWENYWVKAFIELAAGAGFTHKLIEHETKDAVLSIVILERNDD